MSNGAGEDNRSSKVYTAAESNLYIQLRNEAKARLEAGTAAGHGNWFLGIDTLQLLHRLSSDPRTAGDALKLLHELQVHQVELDMQYEEMYVNEQRLIEESTRYKEVYEFAPLGYFLVNFQGEIIESNRAGAELFGMERDELAGGRIDRFLAVESRSVLLSLLHSVAEEGATLACEVTVDSVVNMLLSLRVIANASPDKRCVLLAFCKCS